MYYRCDINQLTQTIVLMFGQRRRWTIFNNGHIHTFEQKKEYTK